MSTPTIDPEFRALIPPLQECERAQLEANLKRDGRCIYPLITWNGILLDGHNRLDICQRNGIAYTVKEVELKDRSEALEWIIQHQFGRRNLTPFQHGELALRLEQVVAARAKENQVIRKGDQHGDKLANVGKVEPVHTRNEIAKLAHVSHGTLHKIKAITQKAPEPVKEALRKGETTINREYRRIVNQDRHRAQVDAVKAAKLPTGKFHVIVADPPWWYDGRNGDPDRRGVTPYPTMRTDEICAVPVSTYAHDNCILWLWTTNTHMREAYTVAEAWGFVAKTILTWEKPNIGCGIWLRGQTEHCLMCIRGKPVITLSSESTILKATDGGCHSAKPDEFYAMVDRLCPGSKCELFSRKDRPGWDTVGAEAGSLNGGGE